MEGPSVHGHPKNRYSDIVAFWRSKESISNFWIKSSALTSPSIKARLLFFSGKSSLCTLENRMHSPFPVFIYLGTILIVPVNPDSRRALKPKGLFPIPNQRSIVSLNLFLIHCFGNLPSFSLIFPLIAHESRKKRLLLSLFPFSKTQNEHSPSWLLSMITGCHLLSKHFQE